MIRPLGTAFAGLLGLIFGSFLNVCLSRWPVGESIAQTGSHCRHCDHNIPWFENIPLLSFLTLGGRCRKCNSWIGWRYPLVELSVAFLWAVAAWQIPLGLFSPTLSKALVDSYLLVFFGKIVFLWLLVCLAVLDLENHWLPNWLTLPGAVLGFTVTLLQVLLKGNWGVTVPAPYADFLGFAVDTLLGILGAALLILLIRWVYFLIRRREGIGLGDAKLMALLAAWLGLPLALMSFGLGVVLGAIAAVGLLLRPRPRTDAAKESGPWGLKMIPLGTFLCLGGIVACLWGKPLLAAYLRFLHG